MTWMITLYENFGTGVQIFNALLKRFNKVYVASETIPYPHYHIICKDVKQGIADTYKAHLKYIQKLKKYKAPHKIYLSVCVDEKAALDYIRKEHGAKWENWQGDSEEDANSPLWNNGEYGFSDDEEKL